MIFNNLIENFKKKYFFYKLDKTFNLCYFDLSLEPILSSDVDLVLSTFKNAEYINEGYISPSYDEYMAYCFYYKRYKAKNNKVLKSEIKIYDKKFKDLDFISFNVLSLKINRKYFFVVQKVNENYFSYFIKKLN